MLKNLLPIGSVVTLKGSPKKVMVIGIKQIFPSEPQTIYDYIGVLYPEGFLGKEANVLFNHAEITEVVFTGYENPEREQFIDFINDAYKKLINNAPFFSEEG